MESSSTPKATAVMAAPPSSLPAPGASSPLEAAMGSGFDEDDLLALSGGASGGGGAGAAAAAVAVLSAMPLTMQALFGPIFQVAESDLAAAKDPALIDTRSILHDLFGAAVHEDDVHLFPEERHGAEALSREMKSNRDVLVYEEGARYFGSAGADVLRSDQHVPFTLLESRVPAHWAESRAKASTPSWLLDMPVIFPSRQTLHADPRPCDPSTCAYLESNKFMLYTPSNVLRWCVGDNGVSSNSRVVRWSDGSITMHVGSDVLTLLPSQDSTLNMLGETLEVGKAGMEIEAVVAVTVPEKHLTARLGEAVSIEVALAQERRQRELENRNRNLPYADSSMPPIDWTKPRKGRTIQEEFVRDDYEMREREMKRRYKEGRPMTLAEQLQLEARLQDHVTGATAEQLQAEREELQRQAALKAAQRAEQGGQKRNRYDRDLTLQGGDPFLGQPADDDEEDDDDGELSVQEDAGDGASDADSFEQRMAEMYARHNAAADAPAVKRSRAEPAGATRYTGLAAALQELLAQIPMDAEAFASVDGTLSFLSMDGTAEETVRAELPKMLAEVAAELPTLSTQRVAAELAALFPDLA